ncbi:ABC transporter ATP-binding protein [Sediminivirga luteola]|uniref:ABC-type quaternary amine transporter n=1 Tax=Sediminivirga luteola TaxID=1774748 RepID=A0A8J2XLT4_9MICO|nr:ABC transporter ATP-binding protein [Sediminivirga luteola]MCI2265014.1 ABC transporter ATP-binding protein [Sediminivirga luteola]GGA25455.1 ABC transporter ATP-binding protein [Sediminivirga luteola]
MTTDARLALEQVTKAFDGRTVLEDISLQLEPGELLTLLGPSGCGKTTALRIIAGFERPDSGRVMLGGREITAVPAHRRSMGVVFQAYSLFPHMTALTNVAYGLKIRRQAKPARLGRAGELLELMGLSEHAHKYPHQLSGGQQQRVALARALAVAPEVLLLDEPLSALDAQVRVQLREEIRRIQRETGTTTIMVTHDQEEALTIADRVAVMRDGLIQQLGAPAELYRQPANAFVSRFLGTVNLVPVTGDGTRIALFGQAVETVGQHDPKVPLRAHIRPEDIELSIDEAGPGMVSTVLLRGATTSIGVIWDDLVTPVRVDLPTREAGGIESGQRVRLGVRVPHVLVEPDPAATGSQKTHA